MKNPTQHLIAEVTRRSSKVGMTIGIDLGNVWSHYCTLNEDGEVVDRGRFRTSPSGVEKWFTDLPPMRIAMEAGTHSIWISEQLQELGHEVIVANVRELRAISHSDRKSDQVDAEKLARYARLDPKILSPIAYRTVAQQEALTLIRARNLIVRLRTAAVNAVRGLAMRLPTSGLVHLVLRQAMRGRAPARSGPGARSGARADRGDDSEDQALRPADQATHGDRVSRDTGANLGLRRRAAHGPDLRPDAGQQGTLPAKSRCRLLSRPAAKAQSVRGSRPAARHHQGWQHLLAYSAGRVCQPCARSAWERFDLTTVGSTPGLARRQAVPQSGHRRRRSQARSAASPHLDHPGAIHPVLWSSSLRKEIISNCYDYPAF